ncbi:MAG: copper-containing nitrite reductase [Chloroflexota bacterium]
MAAVIVCLLVPLLLAACADMVTGESKPTTSTSLEPPMPSAAMEGMSSAHGGVLSFTLRTAARDGALVFIGVGGSIDGEVNPTLRVGEGDMVSITLENGEPSDHDIALPDFDVQSERLHGMDTTVKVEFVAARRGEFPYYCTISGHRRAGMEGKLLVGMDASADASGSSTGSTGVDIVRSPSDLPAPSGDPPPGHVRIDLEAVEVEGRLADGATFTYWTFNGKVPGPFIRVRVGDTVEVHLKNRADSSMTHSIDLHAATGPGGGAAVMQVAPGGEKSFTFKALNPGLYVYHCASPMVAEHLARGMFGLILVEPEGGLPPVDHEFYVMQGEIYTVQPFGAKGLQEQSEDKMLAERPEYFVFNGAVGALSTEQPLRARVGDTIRIYFGVGGPNVISSFHVIGEIFDRVYSEGSLTSPPLTNVQTTLVPAGGATVVELKLEVPGKYTLVDHALSRTERGLMGSLIVEGTPNPDLFNQGETRSQK